MPDDLRLQAVGLDREIAKLAVKLHEHMTTSIEALCVPDSQPAPARSAKAARPSSTSAASPSATARAASKSTASAVKASSSRPGAGQGAPANAAGSAPQHSKAPSGSTNAASKPAAKTDTKSAGRNDFGAALRQAMAPKREDSAAISAAQSQAASEHPSKAFSAKQWIDSRFPGGNFQTFHLESDGSVQYAGDPITPSEGPSQPDEEEGASKQERKRLKRRAQKLRQQQRAQVDTFHVNLRHGLHSSCTAMAACSYCLHQFSLHYCLVAYLVTSQSLP